MSAKHRRCASILLFLIEAKAVFGGVQAMKETQDC
jgi:hypothetical protein